MNNLEIKIKEINLILQLISEAFNSLSTENFDAIMADLDGNLQKVNLLKKELKNEYDHAALSKYEPELNDMAKLIEKKFDNIIEDIKNEQNAISAELSKYQNQRKLINYNR